ncbi:hypothetical protein CPC16_005212 [Podila verticillata]|nr:hypothetical protein CPC16_005212 [Podila verticillata]
MQYKAPPVLQHANAVSLSVPAKKHEIDLQAIRDWLSSEFRLWLQQQQQQQQQKQQKQQQHAGTTGPVTTHLETAQYQPYPLKTRKDPKEDEEKGKEQVGCKACGVMRSVTWRRVPAGEVTGVLCNGCSIDAKLRKVAENVRQRIAHRDQR